MSRVMLLAAMLSAFAVPASAPVHIVAEADLAAGGEKLTGLHHVQGFTARTIVPFPQSR